MRKLFTLALAVLASVSMWAGTIVTLPTDLTSLPRGYSYSYAVPTSGIIQGDKIYFSSYDGKIEDQKINPYRTAFVFKPAITVNLALSFGSTTTSKRTNTATVYEINEKLYDVYVGASDGWLGAYVMNNASEEDLNGLWKDAGVTKISSGNLVLAGDSAKILTGYTPKENLLGSAKATETTDVVNKETVADTIKGESANFEFEAGKAYLIFSTVSSSGGLFLNNLDFIATCEAPATALSLKLDTTKSEGSGLYAGDKITFTISGGNGAETSMTLDGAAFSGTEWTATEGEHTFVLSQDVKDGVCGDEIEVKLNVASKTPVTAATISGPNKTYLGKETTLTCTAENATNYQWYKGTEAISGANAAEYTFTPDAVGDLVFSCEAWNKFNNGTPVKSADHTVTVTEGVCGILADLKVTGKNTGTLTGELNGTVSVSVDGTEVYEGQTGYKLKAQDSHVGFTLTDGTLKPKDKVIVFVTKVSDGKKLQIFSDKGNTLIAETEDLVLGANTFVLGDDADGATGVFVYRKLGGTEGAQYNAYIASVTLKRPCGEESSDATLKSLKVGDDDITLEDGTFEYEYEVPADYTEDQIDIAFELNDANAVADKTSPLPTLVPDEGNSVEVKINVTAEDGTKETYTITITKPEGEKSDDATIKELKIENEVIIAVNDTFSYVVAADVELSDVQVEYVLNHENASASKASPFLVKVPAVGEAATEEELVVTAEDGTTEKTYIISVSRSEEEQGLWDINDGVKATKVVRDGQMYILRGEKTYNVVGAELRQ